MEEQLMTYPQAAEFLGLKIDTLYSMVSRREVPHVRIGRRLVRFDRTELHRWLERHAVRPDVDITVPEEVA